MPIRYYIDFDCTPRRELPGGGEELLNLAARRERADSVAVLFRQDHNILDEEKMRYTETRTETAWQPEEAEVSVAQVRRETALLEELAPHCKGCPAAVGGSPFSCIGRVNLPVSAVAEEWIAEQAPEPGSELYRLMEEALGGNREEAKARLSRWRMAGFLGASEPAPLSSDPDGLTSSDILGDLFLTGHLLPHHALAALLHLGALETEDGRRGDELLAMIQSVNAAQSAEEASPLRYALQPEGGEDRSVLHLKTMLFALYTAFSLQAPLVVRL